MSDVTNHWRRAYENKYLGAWDLWDGTKYREVQAVIERVSMDEVIGEGGRRTTPIQLWLRGKKGQIRTPMIVSKGNGTTLEVMYGPDPHGWIGKEITIYVKIAKRVQKGTGNVLTIRNKKGNADLMEEIQERSMPAIDVEEFGPEGDE